MFDSISAIFNAVAAWAKAMTSARLTNDRSGRKWATTDLKLTKLTVEELQKVTDRSKLNEEFVKRLKEQDPTKRKGVSALQLEIGMLYSFTNGVVQRYKGRMHFYRDDMSQKGARIGATAGQSLNYFKTFKKHLDT